jgi:hypothetical protein
MGPEGDTFGYQYNSSDNFYFIADNDQSGSRLRHKQ